MKFKVVLCLLLTTSYLLLIPPAYAACVEPGIGVKIGECFGFGQFTSLGDATSLLVTPLFSLAAAVVILYFLWVSFKYITARGQKEELAAARQILIHSIIGFIILMFAFLILQFLLSSLFGISGFLIQG